MMRGRWVVVPLVMASLVAGCGPSESSSPSATDGVPLVPGIPVPPKVTPPTASKPASGSPVLPATTEPADLPSEGTTPPVLLVVDVDGVWFWWSPERRELVIDGMVGAALPDRVGGVVFQGVETGAWRADDTDPGVAQWQWVGDGSAQPIRRLQAPGAEPEIVVQAPADGEVHPIDVAIVDGHPTLAYLRTRYFTIASSGENPWWDSARAELVVRDLTDGSERVLRTQSVGWEYSGRSPSLGEALAAEVIDNYGDLDSWVELLNFDGTTRDVAWDLPRCGCHMAADLPPTGSTLVAAMSRTDSAGQATGTIEVVALDLEDGAEQMRTSFSTPDSTRPVFADAVDHDVLVLTATPIADSVQPVISRGDRGPWVQAAQISLSTNDTYLVPDGIFGPRTEDAVQAAQAASGLDPTGTVDAATWEVLGWPVFMRNDPILISADGSYRSLPVAPAGTTTPLTRASPTITLWSGPVTSGPAATEPATTLDTPSTPDPPDPPAPFDPAAGDVVPIAGRLEYITYGEDDPTGLFGVVNGDVFRIVDQPIEWAADDGAGRIVYRVAGTATHLHLPVGAVAPTPVGADFPVRDPRTGGGLMVAVERTVEETASWAVHHEQLIFRDDAGNVVDVAHNPWRQPCEDHCRLDAMLSPDGELLAVYERVLHPEDLGLTAWSDPPPPGGSRAAVGIPARMRVVSLVSGVEVWAMDIVESSLVDFDGDRVIVQCAAPGHCSQPPGAYRLHDALTGEHFPIKWVADDQPFGGSGVSIRLIARQHS